MTTVTPKLADLINHAELNGKPEVAAALKLLRDPVAALEAERDADMAVLLSVACTTVEQLKSRYMDLMRTTTKRDKPDGFESWEEYHRHAVMTHGENARLKARIAELEARTGPVPAQDEAVSGAFLKARGLWEDGL